MRSTHLFAVFGLTLIFCGHTNSDEATKRFLETNYLEEQLASAKSIEVQFGDRDLRIPKFVLNDRQVLIRLSKLIILKKETAKELTKGSAFGTTDTVGVTIEQMDGNKLSIVVIRRGTLFIDSYLLVELQSQHLYYALQMIGRAIRDFDG